MKHFYSVCQSMQTGELRVNEWDIIKETPKTVAYGFPGDNFIYATKNKDYFNEVHLDSKSDYTGRYQDAYVFVGICETKEEAIKKAIPLFKEWVESLSKGIEDLERTIDELEEDNEMEI